MKARLCSPSAWRLANLCPRVSSSGPGSRKRSALNGGGMPDAPIEVRWAVATDDAMRTVVRQGTATAHPELRA